MNKKLMIAICKTFLLKEIPKHEKILQKLLNKPSGGFTKNAKITQINAKRQNAVDIQVEILKDYKNLLKEII